MYDLDAIRATVDLWKLIAADVGPPESSGRFDCPFCGEGPDRPPWCGDGPSLCVRLENRRFYCRDCKARGDAFDWLSRRMNISIIEAAGMLVPDLEAYRKRDQPRSTSAGRGKSSPSKANGSRKPRKSWNPVKAWRGREFRIARCLMDAGTPEGDAWTEARGVVAGLRGSANPEAAWRAYHDANPMLSASGPGNGPASPRRAS
jgi:hypothetical protein